MQMAPLSLYEILPWDLTEHPIKVPLRGTEFSSSSWWKEVIQHLYCWITLLCRTTCRKELREVSSIILTSVNFVIFFLILVFLWLFSIVRWALLLQIWALSHSHLFLCGSLKNRELPTIASIFREWLNYQMSIPLLVTNRDEHSSQIFPSDQQNALKRKQTIWGMGECRRYRSIRFETIS